MLQSQAAVRQQRVAARWAVVAAVRIAVAVVVAVWWEAVVAVAAARESVVQVGLPRRETRHHLCRVHWQPRRRLCLPLGVSNVLRACAGSSNTPCQSPSPSSRAMGVVAVAVNCTIAHV